MPHLLKRNFYLSNLKIFKYQIPLPVFIWFLLATLAALAEISRGSGAINNYIIYKNVFSHTIHQQNLYAFYPGEYDDCNHYGPLFSILIAPFAILPLYVGCFLWCIANAAFLFFAIKQLPISNKQQQLILLIGFLEMMTSVHNVQFNPMLTAWILLSFVYVKKGNDFVATVFIAAGFLVKIYGIVGLCFFLFSENKIKFMLSFIFWMIVFFCLPMLLSSPQFIIQTYVDWFYSLVEKNQSNIKLDPSGNMQDISAMGLFRRIFHWQNFKNIWITAPAAVLICCPFLRFNQYKNLSFQLTYVALVLFSTVLFSSSAESATYVIAVTGFAIWYVLQNDFSNKKLTALLWFVLILTSLSSTDLLPRYLHNTFVKPYALKALPIFTVWFIAIYQLWRKDFAITEK
jgi:hypothetical protein